MTKSNQFTGIALITVLVFLWGFAHYLDPILIPHLKRSFTLTTMQATLVDSAVFIAYFLIAIPTEMILKKWSYKAGIIVGLLVFATRCYLFIPAANIQLYSFFLIALFIIACGLTVLETVANPYISVIGDPESATIRLNFAKSFKDLTTMLVLIVGARLILTQTYSDVVLRVVTPETGKIALASEESSVKAPYFILGIVLVIIAVCFYFAKMPAVNDDNSDDTARSNSIFYVLKHRYSSWAAKFFYVVAQVCVFSLFILYSKQAAGVTETEAAYYLSGAGLALLVGRFLGTGLIKFISSNKLLAIYAAINVLLCVNAVLNHGIITVYILIGICFFMSNMFPTIFALRIKDLKGDTEYGSSLIIMSIVGVAIFLRIFEYISDKTGNIGVGYWIPLICFVVVVFGFSGHKISCKETNTLPV